MNVNILEDGPDWRWYLLFLGVVQIVTISGWLLFKYYTNMSGFKQVVGSGTPNLKARKQTKLFP